jgi:hypothetical protein
MSLKAVWEEQYLKVAGGNQKMNDKNMPHRTVEWVTPRDSVHDVI